VAKGGFDRTTTSGGNAFERLTLDFIPEKEGYLFVYVSNEEPIARDVYFDDLKIVHKQSIIAQTDSYYPFGLSQGNMSYVREGRGKNQFLYNGKELVEGFELGWYDYGARYYAPDLGRWHAVDPLAEKYYDLSLYNYVMNNPNIFIDPDGRNPKYIQFLSMINEELKKAGDNIESAKNAIADLAPEVDTRELKEKGKNLLRNMADLMTLEAGIIIYGTGENDNQIYLGADRTVKRIDVLDLSNPENILSTLDVRRPGGGDKDVLGKLIEQFGDNHPMLDLKTENGDKYFESSEMYTDKDGNDVYWSPFETREAGDEPSYFQLIVYRDQKTDEIIGYGSKKIENEDLKRIE
jgi:RHS repeat-associated protein